MNNIICSLPFNSVSIDPRGGLRACCNSDSVTFRENIASISVDEIINGPSIKSLRRSFLKGEKDPICSRCWKMEEINNKSFRTIANEDEDFGLATIPEDRFKVDIGYQDLRYLDITLGNKCNLACRMCHPGSSSLIAKQFNQLGYPVHGSELIEFDRAGRDKLLQVIRQAPNLSAIYLLGGEPLINDFHDEILDLLLEHDRAKNVTIHYSTNLHSDIEKHLEKWKKFKSIVLSVSIDGSGSVYEYIRWPGSWNKVYTNLQKVHELAQNHKNIHAMVAVTAQNLNVQNLPELIQEIQKIDSMLSFYFIPVTGGNYLTMTPTETLEQAIKDLSLLQDPSNRIPELINYYKDALDKKSAITKEQVAGFFKKQKDFDGLRKQNLFKTMPHFIQLANEYNIELW